MLKKLQWAKANELGKRQYMEVVLLCQQYQSSIMQHIRSLRDPSLLGLDFVGGRMVSRRDMAPHMSLILSLVPATPMMWPLFPVKFHPSAYVL